jgi:GntR family transcriptional regulator/MocR family aminotransferase
MLAVASFIQIKRRDSDAIYIQIANQLAEMIKEGTLAAGFLLPSSRSLATQLGVHRKTVTQAYEELLAQGWLESKIGSGTFVAQNIPVIRHPSLVHPRKKQVGLSKGIKFKDSNYPEYPIITYPEPLHLDDGFPDTRLAPLSDLGKAYRTQLLTGNRYSKLGYSDPRGSLWLRQELAAYLNQTRAMGITTENILITRGTTMGLHLATTAILSQGDFVVTGDTCWAGARQNFWRSGATILTVPVDQNGIDTDQLEVLCRTKAIRMVYVTSHHHYPTTVTLRAERRLKLVSLAEQYGFAIFEDDYDYDFHYLSKPLLPLAATDPDSMVLYCGSFTKSIAPAFRVGYVVAAENLVGQLAQLRRVIDRQGDVVLENAIADLLHHGVLQRHLRKSLRAYRQRRDVFCELLESELSKYIQFQRPDGGLAVWTEFNSADTLVNAARKASSLGLSFSNGQSHAIPGNNCTRLGFASSTVQELTKSVQILKQILEKY